MRLFADFTGADPRWRDNSSPLKPKAKDEPDCADKGGPPAWDAEPEPLRP